MLFVSYHHRQDAGRELILPDGAAFPQHLSRDEWYLHATYQGVSGRTESDIATLGYCDRLSGAIFGRRVAASHSATFARVAR